MCGVTHASSQAISQANEQVLLGHLASSGPDCCCVVREHSRWRFRLRSAAGGNGLCGRDPIAHSGIHRKTHKR
jgi:hypothetical protein